MSSEMIFGGVADGKEIANHGHRADLRGAAAERLNETHRDEPFRRAGEQAQERGDGKNQETDIQRNFATEAIEQRAIEKLVRQSARRNNLRRTAKFSRWRYAASWRSPETPEDTYQSQTG